MANDHEIRIRLETLNEIGQALSSTRDFDSLMERIVEAARTFTQADGVTFYRIRENRLAFDLLRNLSLGLYKGGSAGEPIDLPEIPLHHADGSPNHSLVVAHAALTGNTVNVRDVYSEPGFDFSGTRSPGALRCYFDAFAASLKELAVALFGKNDKAALLIGTAIIAMATSSPRAGRDRSRAR